MSSQRAKRKPGHAFAADDINFEAFVAITSDNRSKPPLDKILGLLGDSRTLRTSNSTGSRSG
jgi:hypothetical protein